MMAVFKKKPPYSSWTSWLDILLLSLQAGPRQEAAEQNWAHAKSLLCLDKHWIILPGLDITYPCTNFSCFASPFSPKRKILKKVGSLSSGHQAFFIHMTGDLCLCWGMGNDKASSFSCKRDFFSWLVKHALKSKQHIFFQTKSFMLTPPEFQLMLFSFLWMRFGTHKYAC